MDLPGLVTSQLGTEEPVSQVPLGGEDLLLVTPSRTLVYRAEGLLRDESITSYPHDCDRVDLSTGRRKATLRLQYIDGPRDFSVPRDRLEDVLAPVLRGVLAAADVTGSDERVEGVYRFSELTYIITAGRVVKHIGTSLWSPDCEVFPFDDVTGLRFEEGSVATAVVIEVDGRPDRVKAPNEDARYVRRDLERVLFDYHDVESLDELNDTLGRDDAEERPTIGFEDDLETLVPDRTQDADPDTTADATAAEIDLDEPGESDTADSGAHGSDGRSDVDPSTVESNAAATDPTAEPRTEPTADPKTEPTADPKTEPTADPKTEPTADPSGGTGSAAGREAGDLDEAGTAGGSDDRSRDGREASSSLDSGGAPDAVDEPESVAVPGDGNDEVVERLEELTAAVEQQNELLATQQRVIKALVKELRQGR